MQSHSPLRLLFLVASLFLFLQTSQASTDVTIDAVTLLLPSHVCSKKLKPVHHKVRAHGGCFRWHSSSPHVVSVTNNVADANACVVNGIRGSTETIVSVVQEDFIPASSVQSNANKNTRQSAWIWAEDIATGRRAECEVFVDKIHHLIIGTSTRRINVGDTESLDIQAFDEHGDIFSTVQGLPFEWTGSVEHVTRKLTFSAANMNVSSTRLALEKLGFGTDRLPIQGVVPGRVKFTAKLLCADEHIHTSVEMLVTEPIGIYPSLVRVCPAVDSRIKLFTRQHKTHLLNVEGDSLSADLTGYETIDGNRVISMPSTQYKWLSDNSSIVSVNYDMGSFEARSHGHTQIAVNDVSLSERTVNADIVVTEPARISIVLHKAVSTSKPVLASADGMTSVKADAIERSSTSVQDNDANDQVDAILPRCDGTYYVSAESQYTAKVYVFDRWNRVIDICDGMEVSITGHSISVVSDEHIRAVESVKFTDGWVNLDTLQQGANTLTVSLNRIVSKSGFVYTPSTALSASVDIVVTAPLQASHSHVLLPMPLVPSHRATADEQCSIDVFTTGGSGRMIWTAHQSDIVQVLAHSQTDKARVIAVDRLGKGSITIKDQCNPDYVLHIPVEVSVPGQMCMLPTSNELVVGESRAVHFHVKDIQGRDFSSCNCLRTSTVVQGGNSIAIASSQQGIACSADCEHTYPTSLSTTAVAHCNCFKTVIKAVQPGFSRVIAHLSGDYDAARARVLGETDAKSISAETELAATTMFNKGIVGNYRSFKPIATNVFSVSKPLELDQTEIVSAVGTTVHVAWSQGPLAWPCHTSGFDGPRGTFSECQLKSSDDQVSIAAVPFISSAHKTDLMSRQGEHVYDSTPALSAKAVVSGDKAIVSVSRDAENGRFALTCLDSHPDEISVTIQVGNRACASNHWPRVDTANVRVRCYQPICSEKREVTLSINAQTHLTLAGYNKTHPHPLAGSLKYFAEDPDVVEVLADGTIIGRNLGVTSVHVLHPHPSQTPLPWGVSGLHDIVVVHVVYQGFRIEGPKALYEGEEVTVSLIGSNGERAGDASYQLVHVDWFTEDPASALSVQPLLTTPPSTASHTGAGLSQSTAKSFATAQGWNEGKGWSMSAHGPTVRLHAHSHAGVARVYARVKVHYPGPSARTLSLLSNDVSKSHSPCAKHTALTRGGEVITQTISTLITIEPKLNILTPQSLLLPPGAVTQLSTSLDASEQYKLTYTLQSSVPGITVSNRGWLTVAAHTPPTSASILITATKVASSHVKDVISDEAQQSAVIHIQVKPLRSLDVVFASQVSSTATSNANMQSTQTSTTDPTVRARVFLANDPATTTSSLEPLCPVSSTTVLQQRAQAMAAKHGGELRSSVESSLDCDRHVFPLAHTASSNVTVSIVSRDARGNLFDSLTLVQRDSSISVTVDRPELLNVLPVSLSSSFSLSGSFAHNVSMPAPSPSSPSVIAGFTFTASTYAKTLARAQSVVVTITSSSISWDALPPIHIQLLVGSEQYCTFPYTSNLGLRMAVPIAPSALRAVMQGRPVPEEYKRDQDVSVVNTKTAQWLNNRWMQLDDATVETLTQQPVPDTAQLAGHIEQQRITLTKRLQQAVESTIALATTHKLVEMAAAHNTTINVSVPEVVVYVRAVDVHTSLALVDVIALHDAHYSIPSQQVNTDKGEIKAIRHGHQWRLRQPEADVAQVTLVDLVDSIHQRFNVTIPLKPRSKSAMALPLLHAVAPNINSDSTNVYFPWKTQQDARAAAVIDFSAPLTTRANDYTSSYLVLAAAKAVHEGASKSHSHTVTVKKTSTGFELATPLPVPSAEISRVWPFPSTPSVSWSWGEYESVFNIHCLDLFLSSPAARNLVQSEIDAQHRVASSLTSLTSRGSHTHGQFHTVKHAAMDCTTVVETTLGTSPMLWLDALRLRVVASQRAKTEHITALEKEVAELRQLANDRSYQDTSLHTARQHQQQTSVSVETSSNDEYSRSFLFTVVAVLVGLFILYNHVKASQQPPIMAQVAQPNMDVDPRHIRDPLFYDYDIHSRARK